MKIAIWLLAVPMFAQVAPTCDYTLKNAPGGSIAVYRNGYLLPESDYSRSGAAGRRTITLNGWTDGDQMTYYYLSGVGVPIPGSNPPLKSTQYLPTKEYQTCIGTFNPPSAGQSCTVPAGSNPILMIKLLDGTCLPIVLVAPTIINVGPSCKLNPDATAWEDQASCWGVDQQADGTSILYVGALDSRVRSCDGSGCRYMPGKGE